MKKPVQKTARGDRPFWEVLSLEEMSAEQRESLCDGCARCCLNKLEDWDTGEIAWTDVACSLLDSETCRCTDYPSRLDRVPDCIELTAQSVRQLSWLPPSCAYRRLADGHGLLWWHPLVSGDSQTVHYAGISVRNRILSEADICVEDYHQRIVDWPSAEGPEHSSSE